MLRLVRIPCSFRNDVFEQELGLAHFWRSIFASLLTDTAARFATDEEDPSIDSSLAVSFHVPPE